MLSQAAHDFNGIGEFDLGILNSTVQYFPSLAYLEEVLEQALNRVAPGGSFFLGDLRSLPLLPLFHLSVQARRVSAALQSGQLAKIVRERLEEENELAINPAFFLALQNRFPRITQVRIKPQRGRVHNELNRFRYDVFLHLDGATPVNVDWIDWDTTGGLENLRWHLQTERPPRLAYRCVPNARLAKDLAIRERLENGSATTLVKDLFAAETADGVEAEDLIGLGQACGYRVELSCARSDAFGSLDVCFTREDQPEEPVEFPSNANEKSGSQIWANDPGWKQRRRNCVRYCENIWKPDYQTT